MVYSELTSVVPGAVGIGRATPRCRLHLIIYEPISGGVPEIIRSDHTGILVEPANADAIAEAVVRLLNDEELSKKIGQAGLRRVQEKFTIEKHVHEIQKVYESVLSST